MVTQQSDQNADIRRTFSRRAAPDLKIIGHSNIFYWWPAWVAGFAVALLSYLQGRDVTFMPEIVERVPSTSRHGSGSDHWPMPYADTPSYVSFELHIWHAHTLAVLSAAVTLAADH